MPALALKTEYRLLNHRGVSINISESHLQIQVQMLETTLKSQLPVPATPNVLKPVFKRLNDCFAALIFRHFDIWQSNEETHRQLTALPGKAPISRVWEGMQHPGFIADCFAPAKASSLICLYLTKPYKVNQSLQSFYLLNDVVVQLQFSQILKLPQIINLQDI